MPCTGGASLLAAVRRASTPLHAASHSVTACGGAHAAAPGCSASAARQAAASAAERGSSRSAATAALGAARSASACRRGAPSALARLAAWWARARGAAAPRAQPAQGRAPHGRVLPGAHRQVRGQRARVRVRHGRAPVRPLQLAGREEGRAPARGAESLRERVDTECGGRLAGMLPSHAWASNRACASPSHECLRRRLGRGAAGGCGPTGAPGRAGASRAGAGRGAAPVVVLQLPARRGHALAELALHAVAHLAPPRLRAGRRALAPAGRAARGRRPRGRAPGGAHLAQAHDQVTAVRGHVRRAARGLVLGPGARGAACPGDLHARTHMLEWSGCMLGLGAASARLGSVCTGSAPRRCPGPGAARPRMRPRPRATRTALPTRGPACARLESGDAAPYRAFTQTGVSGTPCQGNLKGRWRRAAALALGEIPATPEVALGPAGALRDGRPRVGQREGGVARGRRGRRAVGEQGRVARRSRQRLPVQPQRLCE